jgi:hypothetical protein
LIATSKPTVIDDKVRADVVRARKASDVLTMTRKWGAQVAAAGFTAVPNHLLSINQFLDKKHRLSSTELLILLQILSSWWHADQLPFPSKSTIARRLGLSARQVQRALKTLEQKGIIKRIARLKGRNSNTFDLTGLVDKVHYLVTQHPEAFRRQSRASE